jgi:inhibitor of cysteine peptidase
MRNQGPTFLLLAFLAALFTLLSCGRDESAAVACQAGKPEVACRRPGAMKAEAMRLTEKDDGQKISVATGQVLNLSLPENPTTGYGWSVADLKLPDCLAALSAGEYKPDADRIGSGGMMTWRFVALRHGSGELRLVYNRSFETDRPPAKVFTISVEVK